MSWAGVVEAGKFPASREYFRELTSESSPGVTKFSLFGRRDSHLLGQKKPLVAVEAAKRSKGIGR